MININNNKGMQLLLATTNKGKIGELSALLAGLPLQLLTPQEVSPDTRVEETGRTYLENALLKAFAYQAATGLAVLADDTGLEVEALEGAPGLHSARFSPLPGATDADRRALLLAHLAGKPRPWLARFQCVVVVLLPGAEPQVSYGSVEGEIIGEERGEQGFGYDRLFWIPAAGKTMAELGLEGKNRFSHRAAAVKNAIPYLRSVIK
jgi:XTP/dITP diphosphohydrolase